jgi:hypothetical protein
VQLLIKRILRLARGKPSVVSLHWQHAARGQETLGSLDFGAASMAGEEAGRRGIPSLLNPSSASNEGQQEHIASDVTQVISPSPPHVLFLLSLSSSSLPFGGRHERLTVRVWRLIPSAHRLDTSDRAQANRRQGRGRCPDRRQGRGVPATLLRQGSQRFEVWHFFPSSLFPQLVREFRRNSE